MPSVDLTRIGSNIGAMYSLQSLLDINNKLAQSQTRLSTGKRINSAADDPAGLVIATKMNARSEGLRVTMDNISDAKNMLSVAEGGLGKMTDIIIKMRSKANQAASDTLGATERETIQTQLSAFAAQIDDLINETKWNGVKLLDGTVSKVFQTGVDEGETTNWSLSSKHDAASLNLSTLVAAASASVTSGNVAAVGAATNGVIETSILTEFKTGTYKFDVLAAAAADGTTSAISSVNNSAVATGSAFSVDASGTASTAGSQLANGAVTLTFGTWTGTLGVSTGSLAVSVTDTAGTKSGCVIFGGTGGQDLQLYVGTNNARTGVSINIGTGMTALSGTYGFDYIRANTAKIQVQNADGVAVAVDAAGTGASGSSATVGYVQAGGIFRTGRGLDITAGTMSNLVAAKASTYTTETLQYTKADEWSVDVSTAAKAASYMTKANNALDVVNSTMADLGSLMARMSIKEEAASSARINVESAYNRIMNANMAEEQVNASKFLVLQQTAVAMLAQANNAPQALLSLFR